MAEELDYVPLPDAVKGLVHQLWLEQIKDGSGKVLAVK